MMSLLTAPGRRRAFLLFLLVFSLAFSFRLVYVLAKQTYKETGAAEMERAAACLANHGTLGDAFGADSGPTAHVAPLFPLFLSLIYRVFGSEGWQSRLAQQIATSVI